MSKFSEFSCRLILVFALLCPVSQGLELSPEYWVEWNYDEAFENVTFDVIVATRGFVGFGLSPTGGMRDSDVIVGGVSDDGVPYFTDMYAIGNQAPIVDESQDWFLISASENETHTHLRFWRILNTCDEHDWQITYDTQKIIWSYGATDTLSYHGVNRGTRQKHMLDPEMPPPDLSKYKVWHIHNRITVPATPTTYWCSIHKTPNFTGAHHLIGFDVHLPDDVAKRYTHHADIYRCKAPNPEEVFDKWIGDPGVNCYEPDPSKPDFPVHNYCELIEYGWAIGGEATMFPDHVGFPFEPNTYYMLEVHYDNPQSIPGLNFEMGHNMYYTDELRENEAGYLLIGSVVKYTQMMPPNSVDFTQVAHCSPWCTNHFPEEGLNVFAFMFHAHASSKQLKVRIFRDGQEIPWPIYDDFFDFNYQQNRVLREEFKVMPGDHISVECLYDTTWKEGETTIGGRSTREEMCMGYFFYYKNMKDPEVVMCNSEIPKQRLLDFLGIERVELEGQWQEDPTVTAPEQYAGMPFTQVIASLNWTSDMRMQYQNFHRFSEHEIECVPHHGDRALGTYPNYLDYQPEDSCQVN